MRDDITQRGGLCYLCVNNNNTEGLESDMHLILHNSVLHWATSPEEEKIPPKTESYF